MQPNANEFFAASLKGISSSPPSDKITLNSSNQPILCLEKLVPGNTCADCADLRSEVEILSKEVARSSCEASSLNVEILNVLKSIAKDIGEIKINNTLVSSRPSLGASLLCESTRDIDDIYGNFISDEKVNDENLTVASAYAVLDKFIRGSAAIGH